VLETLNHLKETLSALVRHLPSFEVANETALPFGLKPHTRSVSWIVEQVLVQSLKLNANKLGISHVAYENLGDTALHDVELGIGKRTVLVNIKTHDVDGRKNKNDISAVVKLYRAYAQDPNYDLFYATFGIKFVGRSIQFSQEAVHCFSPQFLPIYVNPTNDKIQAFYVHEPIIRSRKEFLQELSAKSTSIAL